MINDNFKTISTASEGLFTDRGSKFFAYAFPIASEDDIKMYAEDIKKEHWKARHHCFAWRLGLDGNQYRANDDGEPSGTAGKPILGQLDSFEVTNVLIIVVRYFGGTKLGVGGLINAYKTAAKLALEQATIDTKTIQKSYKIIYEYGITSQIMSFINQHQLEILAQGFEQKAVLNFAVPISLAKKVIAELHEKSMNEGFQDDFEIELLEKMDF